MADEPEQRNPEEEGTDTTDWKAMSRKWEARSKENAEVERRDKTVPPFNHAPPPTPMG
jgi:hypothetical protein